MGISDELQSFDPDSLDYCGDMMFGEWAPDATKAGTGGWQEPNPTPQKANCVDGVSICLTFVSAETAAQDVLAVPALARALRAVHRAGWTRCTVCVPAPFHPSARLADEIARLAPGLQPDFRAEVPDPADALIVVGERLPSPDDLAEAARGFASGCLSGHRGGALGEAGAPSLAATHDLLRQASREVLRQTAKPGDGIVTRYLNRPISQLLTRWLLGVAGPVSPNVATAGTALIAAAMVACLICYPGNSGLVLGALLFQTASVFDGVDGEVARATFRSTRFGASLDSLVDAATNALFFIGVIVNLLRQGDHTAAATALAALGGLVFGTVLLGRTARRDRGVIDFNAVKQLVAADESPVFRVLTWLTMRDFYALAAAVLIGLGWVDLAVWAFAVVVAGWLLAVCLTLAVKRGARPYSKVVSP